MLRVYKPEYGDLWFRQMMLADPETMSYNRAWGGVIDFPEDDWKAWHSRWIADPGDGRYYRYLTDEAGHFVGEIAYHYDASVRGCMADVIVFSKYRRKGYGGQALELLCSAARENGVAELYDDIAADNPAVSLFLRHGFTEESRTGKTILLKKKL